MVIFHSYVKLPEGNSWFPGEIIMGFQVTPEGKPPFSYGFAYVFSYGFPIKKMGELPEGRLHQLGMAEMTSG